MGWIPCSGNSNGKKKRKNKMKKMEVQESTVDRTKPAPGIDAVVWTRWVWEIYKIMRLSPSLGQSCFYSTSIAPY